jgi:ADP-ribose pyrophosphatase YjhB (NUDIX family)
MSDPREPNGYSDRVDPHGRRFLHGRTDLRAAGIYPEGAYLTEDEAISRERSMAATDDARGGVPAWLAATLNHCTRCGSRLELGQVEDEDRDRLACVECGFIAYVNPRLVVTTIPVTDDGEVLLLRRGIEPARGLWAQPGGFLEIDETVREAAVRETLEEIGVVVEPGEILGLYSRPEAAIVVVAFEARIVGGEPHPTPEALEVRPFAPEEIPWHEIAFRTSEWALRDWLKRARPDLHPAARG